MPGTSIWFATFSGAVGLFGAVGVDVDAQPSSRDDEVLLSMWPARLRSGRVRLRAFEKRLR
jgi:hypothetical protein